MANSAKADLQEGLGPEFADFDVSDLNPRSFVRKHLLDDMDDAAEGLRDRPGAAAAVRRAPALGPRGHLRLSVGSAFGRRARKTRIQSTCIVVLRGVLSVRWKPLRRSFRRYRCMSDCFGMNDPW